MILALLTESSRPMEAQIKLGEILAVSNCGGMEISFTKRGFILISIEKLGDQLWKQQNFTRIYVLLCLFLRQKLRNVSAKITQSITKRIMTNIVIVAANIVSCLSPLFLLQLLSAATATSLTSRTATSPPPTRSTVSELWFSSPATPATPWSKAPLSSSASARGIRTGMTRSLFAKVSPWMEGFNPKVQRSICSRRRSVGARQKNWVEPLVRLGARGKNDTPPVLFLWLHLQRQWDLCRAESGLNLFLIAWISAQPICQNSTTFLHFSEWVCVALLHPEALLNHLLLISLQISRHACFWKISLNVKKGLLKMHNVYLEP